MKGKFTVNVISHNDVLDTGKIKSSENEILAKEYSLDDAIRLTGSGRFHMMIVFFSGLVIMGATIENISVSFILPYANCDLHLSTLEFTLFGSVPFLGVVLSSHFWGFLADTWGRRNVIRLTAILSLIISIISTLLTNIVALILFRLMVGLCISGMQASVFSYVSEFHTKETAPRAAAIVSTFMPVIFLYSATVGIILMPMTWSLDLYFVTFTPWRLFMVIISLANLVNSIAFSFLPESPKFLLAMNRGDETLMVLKSMYRMNTKNAEDSYPVKYLFEEPTTGRSLASIKGFANILKLVWSQTKPIFVRPYVVNTLALCYMIFALFAIGHGSFMWFPDFIVQLQSITVTNQTLCDVVGHERDVLNSVDECNIDYGNTMTYKVIFITGLLFTALSGIISFYLNKIGPKFLAPSWIIVSAISIVGLNFLTDFYLIVTAFVVFLSCSLCAAIIGAISVNLYPVKIRAMATCFIFMCGRLGGLAGSNLIGVFLGNNCSSIFNSFGVLALSCAVVFLVMPKEEPKETNGQDNADP